MSIQELGRPTYPVFVTFDGDGEKPTQWDVGSGGRDPESPNPGYWKLQERTRPEDPHFPISSHFYGRRVRPDTHRETGKTDSYGKFIYTFLCLHGQRTTPALNTTILYDPSVAHHSLDSQAPPNAKRKTQGNPRFLTFSLRGSRLPPATDFLKQV